MYCNKCGNQLSENELVCQKCGNAIEKNNSRSKTTFNRQQFTPKQSTANYTQAQTIQSSQKFDILNILKTARFISTFTMMQLSIKHTTNK